jgi:hypothetical protein
MHAVRGLRQAVILIVGFAALAVVAAVIWSAVAGGGIRVKVAIALLVVAVLVFITSNGMATRPLMAGISVLQGLPPDDGERADTGGLTGVGIFLLVGLPLFLAGAVLYGTG